MAKEICISTTPHETRLAILEDDQLTEVYYERENEYTLAGSVYKGRVTRVLPGMQSSFVDIGLERDAFLYVTDFLEEQEDGEEYETSSGSGPARGRRGGEERAPEREEGAARREGGRRREAREPREARTSEAAPERNLSVEAVPAAANEEPENDETSPEGTRRWRGRRRRGRGVRAAALGSPAQEEPSAKSAEGLPPTPERGAPGGIAAASADIDEVRIDIQASAVPERAPARGSDRRDRDRSRERDRSAEPSSSGSSPATIVLPGESIAKYGGKPSDTAPAPSGKAAVAAPSKPVNYVAPRPSTERTVSEGWDGGFVLPGESLARHRNKPAAETVPVIAAAAEDAPAVEAAHFETVAAEAAPEVALIESFDTPAETAPTHVEEPVAAPEFAAEALPGTPASEQISTSSVPVEPEVQTAHAAAEFAADEAAAAANVPAETTPAQPAAEEEYEPTDGGASVRLSPPTSQELRRSSNAPLEEHPIGEHALEDHVLTAESPAIESVPETVPEAEPEIIHLEASSAVAEPATETVEEELTEESEEFESPSEFVEEAEESEITEAEHHLSTRGTDGFAEMVDQLHGFAPGPGLLEEEVIDEEEYEFEPIHAHADEHDEEDLVEETLDGLVDTPISESFAMESEQDEAEDEESEHGEHSEAPETAGTFYFESTDEDEDEDEAPETAEAAGRRQPAPRRSGGGDERGRRNGRNGRGGRGDRSGGRRNGGHGQNHALPIISDLLKEGQEILVQIAKEPIAKKGARITSHIALPGRFLVFMPTVNHVGVSRKIASDEERQRLKRILISEKGDSSGGFIVRTAADGASEDELRADLRFLINLWTEVKGRADNSKAPALIYHDLNLVERILRDQVSSNFSAIWVDTEQEYERIVRFLNRFQPSLVRRVKLYVKETPLFEHFGIQDEISKALKSKVWLKSGGSIVINQTEALVAIDINTGKYVGKTSRLEDTIVKTNLDAIPEIVRQIRLRDLGGIIVIDFIDMDERKNRQKVLQALEEALKADRAPSKVLQFNDFGLVAITRKRVKQSLERTLSVPCTICTGTGMVKSPATVCNEIYIELRKMQKHLDGKDVMLRVNPDVVKQLKAGNGRWINDYEEMIGKTIIIKSDPSLHPEQFDIH